MSRQMNILLVEDNSLDAMMVQRALAKIASNAVTTRAEDGVEALEIINSGELSGPFFVLLDINMPRMNGHEFLKEFRTTSAASDSVVFMFTTSDSPQDIAKAYRQRANGYIVKPHNREDMKKKMSTLQGFWTICEPPVPPV
ncbi:response regulator [Antarctobacter sp.]|uniref:response regulator n=1 Tax=Antarctobacter sp. TaxID=1872577 RepID=UPI002B266159|nr:response regulator [Antarctobacter sp.]